MRAVQIFFFLLSALPGLNAPAQAVSKFDCYARTRYGVHYKFKADLPKKTYVLVDKNGVESVLFDLQTACGWKPGSGGGETTCPLDAQTGPDGYLAVSLECRRVVGGVARLVTTGSLTISHGSGHLVCYVYGNPTKDIGLSDCIAN